MLSFLKSLLSKIYSFIQNLFSKKYNKSIETKEQPIILDKPVSMVSTTNIFTLKTRYKVIMITIALVGAYAAGRWASPQKIKIEKQIVEVEKKSKDKDTKTARDTHKKTKTVEVDKPNGEKEVTTIVEEDTKVNRDTKSKEVDSSKISESDKSETTWATSKVTISVLGGVNFGLINPTNPLGVNPFVYGGSLTKPVYGPLTLGVWGLSNGSGGVSVGLTF